MKYVFVGQKKNTLKIDYRSISIRLSENYLVSLIEGLNTKEFGFDTLSKIIKEMRDVKINIVDKHNAKFYVDSGGYSIIKGDVPPSSTNKFISCYLKYLEDEWKSYDYIFSLDIPINLKYPIFNSKKNIYSFNKESLSKSIDIIQKNPLIKEKFIFVWQFKLLDQYEIWSRLFNELNIRNSIQNYAIGGQVGLRGLIKGIDDVEELNFSPFIALCYRILYDFIESSPQNNYLLLHNLGIYIRYDRFEIILLEKLFRKYLENIATVDLSYDSINYMKTSQLKVKNLEIWSYENDILQYYQNILDVPEEILQLVYQEYFEGVLIERGRLKQGNNLDNIDTFIGLNVYSNICLDKFFTRIIDKYNFAEEMLICNSYDEYQKKINKILENLSLSFPNIFTSRLNKCIKENLRLTYIFHNWFMKDREFKTLDKLIKQFIKKIGVPFSLS